MNIPCDMFDKDPINWDKVKAEKKKADGLKKHKETCSKNRAKRKRKK